MGPSGSGKSTLLHCLSGLDEPDGGVVTVAGQRVSRRSEPTRASIRARSFGILLQSGNLVQHLTVCENIRLQMMLAGKMDGARLANPLADVGLALAGALHDGRRRRPFAQKEPAARHCAA
ncbi:ATP-binding cassette domain-containing protein [Rhizobium sp. PL01]|uniref:ATP-binding cassette domain-containing protein n=1 Tax=Rhizobium sp. PL01 TaxID=3085631 RepID=UPI0029810D2B|nr:ATP-binding cassette domain-containing protein [Rhizobium sp. PL01]MDW5317126.1 ATP-binding cassette domain-containing protein [Rhizobium sp. PL01]